ncbi:MAG TPA: response regulator [Chitinophagales bacterium]|nr:response regulator [Chitinophagales bacterium]
MKSQNPIEILIADDDAEDRMLIIDALKENRLRNNIQTVENGEELMEYLRNTGKYTDRQKYPRPGILLLDLNMPKKDGREVLKEIRADEQLKGLPIIILTTSKAEEDILKTYNLGVNSFITKPVHFTAMVDIMKTLNKFWLEIVELPLANR